jgi:hypothetical protein
VPGSQNVQFGSADGFICKVVRTQLAGNGSGNVPGNVIESINFQLPAPSANPVIVTATS